jgi:hypothetical protein
VYRRNAGGHYISHLLSSIKIDIKIPRTSSLFGCKSAESSERAQARRNFAVITKGHSINGTAITGRPAPAKHIDYALFGFRMQSPFLRQSLKYISFFIDVSIITSTLS